MIIIASDHAGYELKKGIKEELEKLKVKVEDLGTYSTDSVDYPDYGIKLGEKVASGTYDFGVAICGTGIGISISANKVKGVRAALVYDDNTAILAKQHNNANVIAFGGRTTKLEDALRYIKLFRKTQYEPRHQSRLDKISRYEEGK